MLTAVVVGDLPTAARFSTSDLSVLRVLTVTEADVARRIPPRRHRRHDILSPGLRAPLSASSRSLLVPDPLFFLLQRASFYRPCMTFEARGETCEFVEVSWLVVDLLEVVGGIAAQRT